MKDQLSLVAGVYQVLKENGDELDVIQYLRSEGIEPGAQQEEIISIARSQLLQEKLKYLPKRNLLIFYAWLLASLFIFIMVLFYFPSQQLYHYAFLFSFFGTLTFTFCLYMAFLYNNTWTPEFLQFRNSPKLNFSFFPFFLVPAVIVYFIISWRFSSAADSSLSEHMEKASGTIIDGRSLSSKKFDFSEVTVAFKTIDGKEIVATEDVSKYTFRKFYKGQTVDLIYSTVNPSNIDLLTPETDVRGMTGSEDRDIDPKDLIDILSVTNEDAGKFLDKITFGWNYQKSTSSWINSRKNIVVMIDGDQVQYVTTTPVMYIFPKNFKALGILPASTNSDVPMSRKDMVFENEIYHVILQFKKLNELEFYTTTITKK